MVIILRKFFLVFIVLLTGCSLNNSPTSKVEELLGKYQGLDQSITYNYLDLSSDVLISEDIENDYVDVIKKQYRNMSYEVKDENIDGDMATVTVQVEVIDYKKVINEYDIDRNDDIHKEIIDKLNGVKEKVNYTIDFTVVKDKDGNWNLGNLTEEIQQKLLGIY